MPSAVHTEKQSAARRSRRLPGAAWVLSVGISLGFFAASAFASTWTVGASDDTTVNDRAGTNSNGALDTLLTGTDNNYSSSGHAAQNGHARSLIKFALPAALASKVIVTSVVVKLFHHPLGTRGDGTLSLQPIITHTWVEGGGAGGSGTRVIGVACTGNGASYNNADCSNGGTAWGGISVGGANYGGPATNGLVDGALLQWSSGTCGTLSGATAGTMCGDVESWIDGTNFGWRLRSSTDALLNATAGNLQGVYSRQGPTSPTDFTPKLVITFTTCNAAAQTACETTYTCGTPPCNTGNSCVDAASTNSIPNPSYSCSCSSPAYTGNGTTACANNDECTATNPCGTADGSATCADVAAPGTGHNCTCSSGAFIVANQGSSNAACVSACCKSGCPVGYVDPCGNGGTCAIGGGGWTCSGCSAGYESTTGSQQTCVSINGCTEAGGNAACVVTGHPSNACINDGLGVHHCTCADAAYVLSADHKSCVNKNECLTNHCLDGGDIGAICSDHPAPAVGYDCSCTNQFWTLGTVAGFETCVDDNECATANPCLKGKCTNVTAGGGYTCVCDPGYILAGGIPSPAPSCVLPSSCDSRANAACASSQKGNACVNDSPPLIGFTCSCQNAAYVVSSDGQHCLDKDECNPNHCTDGGDLSAICTDHVAPLTGYDCACDPGSTFDGTTCVPGGHCLGNGNPCGHGQCNQLNSGYQCFCEKGYNSTPGAAPTCVAVVTTNKDVTATSSGATGCACSIGAAHDPMASAPLVLSLLLLIFAYRRAAKSPFAILDRLRRARSRLGI